MLLVRKNLTEILLEVTNDLIFDISKETVSKLKKGSCKNQNTKSILNLIPIITFSFQFVKNKNKKPIRIKYFCSFSFLLI